MSWFHHVHSLAEENVSLNFWFYDSGFLFEPSKASEGFSGSNLGESLFCSGYPPSLPPSFL